MIIEISKFQILTSTRLRRSLVGTLAASLLAVGLFGCGDKDAVEVGQDDQRGPRGPVIRKGTKTVSLVEGNAGQLKLMFDELSWGIRSADIAINKVAQDEQDGCVNYKRIAKGSNFAMASFNCTTEFALGAASAKYRRVLKGQETYSEGSSRSAFINMSSTLTQTLYKLEDSALVGYGRFTRNLKVVRPESPDESHTLDFQSKFTGTSAQDSDRLAEAFEMEIDGDYSSSRVSGLKIPKGLTVKLIFAPEREKTEKVNVSYQLVATSDVTYSTDGSCLRPIGTFSWTRKFQGKTSTGTLTTTPTGIKVSGDAETTPWGAVCLEQ